VTLTRVQLICITKATKFKINSWPATWLCPRIVTRGSQNLKILAEAYRGADKSLARPGRKEGNSDKTQTFKSHSKKIQKAVRPTSVPWQQ